MADGVSDYHPRRCSCFLGDRIWFLAGAVLLPGYCILCDSGELSSGDNQDVALLTSIRVK